MVPATARIAFAAGASGSSIPRSATSASDVLGSRCPWPPPSALPLHRKMTVHVEARQKRLTTMYATTSRIVKLDPTNDTSSADQSSNQER